MSNVKEIGDNTADELPREIKWISLCLLGDGVVYLISLITFLTQREEILATIARTNPDLSQSQINTVVTGLLIAGSIFHVLLAGLFTWFAFTIRTGGTWMRTGVSVLLVLATGGTLYSAATGPHGPEKLFNGISLLLKLVALGLLWVPQSSRTYFAATDGGDS